MKSAPTLSFRAMLAIVVPALAAIPSRADDGFIERHPGLAGLVPREVLAGAQAGFAGSRFAATDDYRALIEPTSARSETWWSPSFGATATARWGHGFSLTAGAARTSYGLDTREENVSFQGNPFPHTLSASTRLEYDVWSIEPAMGWYGPRSHFQVGLGAYKAILNSSDIAWTVDGQPYPDQSGFAVKDDYAGWMFALEYGVRAGAGEVLVGAQADRSFDSLLNGLKGSIRASALRLQIGYAWIFLGRFQ